MSSKIIQNGAIAGLVGGVVFGIMMGMMGMLPMIGAMAGSPTAAAGFIIHLLISAMIGISFALIFHSQIRQKAASLGYGFAYGALWWLLGPLTLMPLMMGMGVGVNWNVASATSMLPSLLGHVIYGLILGFTYGWLADRGGRSTANPRAASDLV